MTALDPDFVGLLAPPKKLTTAVNDKHGIPFARLLRLERLCMEGKVDETELDAGVAKSHMLSIHALVAVSLWNLKTKTLHRHVRRCTEATTTCQHCQPEGKSFEWIDPLAILSLFLNDDDLFCGKILLSTSMVPLIVSATSASRCTARTILEGFHK